MYMDGDCIEQWNPMMLLALLCNRQCCFGLVQMFWPQVVLLRAHSILGGEVGRKDIKHIWSFASNMVQNHEVTKSDLVVPPVQCLAKSADVSSGPACL